MNATAPPIAGLCTYAQGGKPGYSVERTVQLLRRYLFYREPDDALSGRPSERRAGSGR